MFGQKNSKKESPAPEHAGCLEIKLSSGKRLIFRQAKMSDQRECSRIATKDGKTDFQYLGELFLVRLLVAMYRANGEKIDPIDRPNFWADDKYLSYGEMLELQNCADDIIQPPSKKKAAVRRL